MAAPAARLRRAALGETRESFNVCPGFGAYDGLAGLGYKPHFRAKHSHDEFARGRRRINGIENF